MMNDEALGPKKEDRDFVAPKTGGDEPQEPTRPQEPTVPTHYPLEGKSTRIENPEILKDPGEIMETVRSGMTFYYAEGVLVRDSEGQIAKVVKIEQIASDYRPLPKERDPSVREPKKYTDVKVTVQYADGGQKSFTEGKQKLPEPLYRGEAPTEAGELAPTILELRGHTYRLGELVSFGNNFGELAAIFPAEQEGEETYVGIVAKIERGKPGNEVVWKVRTSDIDYIEHTNPDGTGAIKRNPDNTIFKPSLSRE